MKKKIVGIVLILIMFLPSCTITEPVNQGSIDTSPLYIENVNQELIVITSNYTDFANHSGRHENNGVDEIDIVGMSGLLADDQHVLDSEVVDAITGAGLTISNDGSLTRLLSTAGDYIEIGNAGSMNYLSDEDDLLVSGKLEVNDNLYVQGSVSYFGGSLYIADNSYIGMGGQQDAKFEYNTGDGNARSMIGYIRSDAGSGYNIPFLIWGWNNIEGKNFGWFDGIDEPNIVVTDSDANRWIGIGFSDNDTPSIQTNADNLTWILNGNVAMTLSENGTLEVDSGYGTFDLHDDAMALKRGIQQSDYEYLVSIGVMREKDTVEVSYKNQLIDGEIHSTRSYKTVSGGGGYVFDVQALMRLLAGGVTQNRDYIDTLEARIAVLEKR